LASASCYLLTFANLLGATLPHGKWTGSDSSCAAFDDDDALPFDMMMADWKQEACQKL
jgi:hypothetical protein